MAMIQVETTRMRRIFTVMSLYKIGFTTARNRSTAISTKLWVDTENEMSLRKVHILHRNRPAFPSTRKALEPIIALVISRGMKKIAARRSDAAMLAIVTLRS